MRAKRTLAEKQVPFEVPLREELPERLASVLEVLYLIFNEGYSATAGSDWMRGELCAEAMRLGRHADARAEFERAAALTRNQREKALLLERAKAL